MSNIGLKLGALLVRQISRPIASALRLQAKEHEAFKKFCISIAQRIHKTDINLKMKLMGQKGAKVRPLNSEKAIENGATFLSETFIFAVAGGVVFFESYRQRQKELARRETVADDIKTLQYEIQYLKKKLEQHNVKFDDYVPPNGMCPSILKLDQNGDQIDLIKLQDKVEELDRRTTNKSEGSKSEKSTAEKSSEKPMPNIVHTKNVVKDSQK